MKGGENLFVGFSSFDIPYYHLNFPWKEFCGACDANFPQLYAYEHDDQGYVHWSALFDKQWHDLRASIPEVDACPIYPIGACYRPLTRAGKSVGVFDPKKLAKDIAQAAPKMTGGWYTIEALMDGPHDVLEALLPGASLSSPPPPDSGEPPAEPPQGVA